MYICKLRYIAILYKKTQFLIFVIHLKWCSLGYKTATKKNICNALCIVYINHSILYNLKELRQSHKKK